MTHLLEDDAPRTNLAACGTKAPKVGLSHVSGDPREVTCSKCRGTVRFRMALGMTYDEARRPVKRDY